MKQVLRGGKWFDATVLDTFSSSNGQDYTVVKYDWDGMTKVDTIRANSGNYRDKPPEMRTTTVLVALFIDKHGFTRTETRHPALSEHMIYAMKLCGYRLLGKEEVTFTYPDPAG